MVVLVSGCANPEEAGKRAPDTVCDHIYVRDLFLPFWKEGTPGGSELANLVVFWKEPTSKALDLVYWMYPSRLRTLKAALRPYEGKASIVAGKAIAEAVGDDCTSPNAGRPAWRDDLVKSWGHEDLDDDIDDWNR